MADENKQPGASTTPPEGDMVKIPLADLTKIQETLADQDRKIADMEAKNAGLEELFAKGNPPEGEKGLRTKKTFEPKFRTVVIRKYPKAGDVTNMGYVIGWSNRGAYQEVDRTGVSPQVVDFIDIFFLGDERTPEGKLKAEKVRLLDLLNKSERVHCKILDTKIEKREEPTGEEINVSTFDPQHGLVSTGDTIDGYVTFSDITYTVQIPGVDNPVTIDGEFCN